jgi:peptide/nickel transport system permease protein
MMKQELKRAIRVAADLIEAERWREASSILSKILQKDPNIIQAWYLLSFSLKDREKRIYSLERALQLSPDYEKARVRLAQITDSDPEGERSTSSLLVTSGGAAGISTAETVRDVRAEITTPRSSVESAAWMVTREPGFISDPWQRVKIRAGLFWRRFKLNWGVFSQSRLGVIGLVLILLFGLMAIAHPILMNTVWSRNVYDPVTGFDINVFPHPSPPGPSHILGTDTLGRDVLSMLLAATTPTFIIGLTAALTTAIVGTTLSVLGAYFRGKVDTVITNLADVFLLFPAPVVMVIIGARFRELGPMPLGLIYGFVTGAGGTVIVMRTHAQQVVAKPYMEAARVAGGGASQLIIKHMLPAMMPLAALQMMIAVTGAVVADGFISFFGLTRVVNNWGTIIYDALVYAASIGRAGISMWHMLVPAAICFSLFAMGFYLVSRGLHRVAAPRIRVEY